MQKQTDFNSWWFYCCFSAFENQKGLIGGGGRLESLLCMRKKYRLSYNYYIDLFYCRR
jgi:hypothetical protein